MDRNTIIGLGLIGVILAVFTFFNQPSAEELREKAAQQELVEQQQKADAEKEEVKEVTSNEVADNNISDAIALTDSLDTVPVQATPATKSPKFIDEISEELFTLENDKIQVVLTNKGGGVKSVFLKEYQTYSSFMENEGTDKIDPLQLFDEDVATNGLKFNLSGREIKTKDIAFEVKKESDNYISFIAHFDDNKSIEQIYYITPEQYHMNYEIKMNGFDGDVASNSVYLDWKADLLKSEKLLSEQRRVSTVFYQEKNGSYKYLSEMSDDDKNLDKDVDWVAFKQSYFSSIMMPKTAFDNKGTYVKISKIAENTPEDSIYVKTYEANLNLGMSNTASGVVEIDWYFGPNDFDVLASYQNGAEDIVNYGWGLFRWINIYVIQPLFEWISGFGFNLGISILILTIIIKLVLTPVQWKMFASSAKMKILKPEVDEINQKYPDKEDAMKKQMEMMALYKESGASPMAGCFPMLIQMPILFAVFRFFPSTFALRQKGFLWAEDLSSYDSIFDLGFNIPFYGDHISLFTLLMAGTTLFYTVLNSSNMQQPSQPGMPNMKIIMYFFPIMMIFFFNNYASGLSFYYFISTLMSILTMIMIKNFFVDEDKLKAKMEARKIEAQSGGKKKGKSKFQERLEQMQKAQQERLKNQGK